MPTIILKHERRKGLRIMPDVSKETFQGYSVDSKLNTLFDYQVESNGLLERTCSRVDKVEAGQRKWKVFSSAAAFMGGIFGGAIAFFSSKFFTGN